MWGSKWLINLFIVAFLVILTGLFLPEEYEVERSIEINASADKVYAAIVDLRKWEQWSTWYQMDPKAAMTYDGPDRAIGMRVRWSSEIIGRGTIEITSLQFNRQLVYSVDNPVHGITAYGELRLKPLESGTELTWRSRGNVGVNIIDRYKLLFFDNKLGKDIQVGLENIKTLVENSIGQRDTRATLVFSTVMQTRGSQPRISAYTTAQSITKAVESGIFQTGNCAVNSAKRRLIASLASTKLADLLISAKTTLPALMLALGAPAWMISWLVPIRESGALLPQAAIGVVLRNYPARHHVWRLGMVVQSFSLVAIILGAFWYEGMTAGWFVLGGLCLLSLGRSACSLTMKDVQADVAEQGDRGKLLGIASTSSGVLTLIIAVPLVYFAEQLGETLIFGLLIGAVSAMLLGLFILLPLKTCVEAEQDEQQGGHSWWDFDAVVYKFIVVRGLFVHSALVAPYFMLETEQEASSLLPFYLGAQAAATMLSSFIWGSVADHSARLTLQLAGVLALIACGGLLLLPGHSLWISGGLFFVLAVAHTGVRTGRKTYSLDVKDGQQRTELVAFSNTAIGLILLGFGALYAALKAAFDINIVATMAAMLLIGIGLSFILPKEKQ